MIGCLGTRVRKQPIIELYLESENELKVYILEARKRINHKSQANLRRRKEETLTYNTHLAQLMVSNQRFFISEMSTKPESTQIVHNKKGPKTKTHKQ